MTPLRDACERRLERARPVLKPQVLIHQIEEPAVSLPKKPRLRLGSLRAPHRGLRITQNGHASGLVRRSLNPRLNDLSVSERNKAR